MVVAHRGSVVVLQSDADGNCESHHTNHALITADTWLNM